MRAQDVRGNPVKILKFFLLLSCFSLFGFMSSDPPDADVLLQKVKQDVFAYLPTKTPHKELVTPEVQHKLYQAYLTYYFSPWNNETLLYSKNQVKSIETKLMSKFMATPGWGSNQRLHSSAWVNDIAKNMSMETYPNSNQTAITVQVAHLRELPTLEPSFKKTADLSDGYPFDRIEASLLPANLPIKVVQISHDRAWGLVITPYNAVGWLPFNEFAFVDRNFMEAWQTGDYAGIIKDKLPLLDLDKHFLFFGRIGSLQPIVYSRQYGNSNDYHVLVAMMGSQHEAIFQAIWLSKNDAVVLPMPLTAQNIAKIANVILGQPYDWGGHYGYRDCSSTMMDLFSPFGLWLPRSSVDQAHAGKFISLANLSDAEKKTFIKQNAVPFITLLSLPGHIVLYLGEQGDRSFIYQTMWGIPIQHWFTSNQKLIIGKTVITPLELTEDSGINSDVFLKRVVGMRVLGEAP